MKKFFKSRMSPTLGKTRKQPTARQKKILMKIFQTKPYPKIEEKYELATLLNISKKRVEDWFNSRRYFERKKEHSLHMGE